MVYQAGKADDAASFGAALSVSAGWSRAGLIALAAVLAFAVGLFAPQVLGDGDTYWHIAAGQWMLDHHQVIRTDSFSYTFAGKPWDTHEWLAELVMALAWRVAGWAGMMALTGAAAATAIGLTAARLSRLLTPTALILALALIGACLAPSFLARPHFLALPLLVLWIGALLDARAAGRAPSPAWLLLMIAWANAHASFLFGILLVGAFALDALLTEPKAWRRVFLQWGGFGVGAVLAALITPHGLDGLLFPLKVNGMGSLAGITEWRSPDFQHLPPVEIAILAGLWVMLSRGVRLAPARLGLLLALLYMTLAHVRHETLLVLIGAPLLAEALAGPGRVQPDRRPDRRAAGLAAAGIAALCLLRLLLPFDPGDGRVSPVSALAHVPAALRAQPVFNSYDLGGYLIYARVKPFIDGRTDMYGDAFIARYDAMERPGGEAFDAAAAQYRIAWTFLEPSSPLIATLDADPRWRRLYADRYAVVHVRR
ncbi:MAG TPA: hypothetical protein VMU59_03150 [Caulobacteraceae bacterium]|nr:hypothetical protein [Caulobacteraceae bacterium]